MSSSDAEATPPPDDSPDFEASLARLEQIVRQLEQGDLTLQESLACYEEGVGCLHRCHQALSHAEARIELLFRIDEDGQAEVRPFAEEEMTLEQKQAARGQRRSQSGELF